MRSIALFLFSGLLLAATSVSATTTPHRCTRKMRDNGECGSPRYHGVPQPRQLQALPTPMAAEPTDPPAKVKIVYRTRTVTRVFTRTLTVTPAAVETPKIKSPEPLPIDASPVVGGTTAVLVTSLVSLSPTPTSSVEVGVTLDRPRSTPTAPRVCATKILAGQACSFESASCCSTGTICVGQLCTPFCTLSSIFPYCDASTPCATNLGYVCSSKNTCQPPIGAITVSNGETCDQGNGNTRFCIGGRGLCIAGKCEACTQVA